MKLLGVLLLFCGLAPALGQAKKIGIVVDCNCTDPVGTLYATALRDQIATSPRYELAYKAEEKDASGKTVHYHFHLKVVTLDPTNSDDGLSTVISAVLLVGNDTYLTQQVQSCGRSRVKECASGTLAFIDGYLN